MTPIRKAMIWAMSSPASAYVCMSGSVDFGNAQAYLDTLKGQEPPVSVQHLLVATIGRVLKEYPEANARVIGKRIHQLDHVGVMMPVNLLGHEAGKTRGALGVALVEQVERKTLRQIAASTTKTVRKERSGDDTNRFLALVWRLAEHAPQRVLERALDGLLRAINNPRIYDRVQRAFPATTLVSNVGAVLGREKGSSTMQFRAGALVVPPKLSWLGTIWGTSFVQDEVVPIDGVPTIRPMLPLMFIFDHRLFDGVIAGRMMIRVADILSDPAVCFGADGNETPPW